MKIFQKSNNLLEQCHLSSTDVTVICCSLVDPELCFGFILLLNCLFFKMEINSATTSCENVQENTETASKKLKNACNDEQVRAEELKLDLTLVGVGILESVFNKKNGTPRQSGICPQSKGIIRLHKKLFNNPMHALEGIEQFKYVW